jgi:hypothetical protein
VTHCWIKSCLEKAHLFKSCAEILPLLLQFSQERNHWIMSSFKTSDFTGKELLQLNHFRIHQQVLFLSNVLDASGKLINQRYMCRQEAEETLSTLFFSRKNF